MRTLLAALLLVLPACAEEPDGRFLGPERTTISLDDARRVAQAGVLRATDLPGYRPVTYDDESDPFERASCMRVHEVYAEKFRDFVKGDELTVGTRAAAMATEVDARTDLDAWTGKGFAACLKTAVTSLVAEQLGADIRGYRSRTIALRVPGAVGTFGYSIRMAVYFGAASVPVRYVLAGAVSGHAEVIVNVLAVEGAPVPSDARLQAWLRTMVGRVRAVDV